MLVLCAYFHVIHACIWHVYSAALCVFVCYIHCMHALSMCTCEVHRHAGHVKVIGSEGTDSPEFIWLMTIGGPAVLGWLSWRQSSQPNGVVEGSSPSLCLMTVPSSQARFPLLAAATHSLVQDPTHPGDLRVIPKEDRERGQEPF